MKLSSVVFLPVAFVAILTIILLASGGHLSTFLGTGNADKNQRPSPEAVPLDESDNPPGAKEVAVLPAAPPVSEPIEAVNPPTPTSQAPLIVADFDSGDKPNNLGGDFGSWNRDPNDDTQSCNLTFETDDALNDPAGYSLKLDYDVDSPHPAYNGFWMKLNGLDLTEFKKLSFSIRGDGLNNFTSRVKVELKDDSNNSSSYVVSGITESWQKVEVLLSDFRKIKDWKAMSEFVIVFDDTLSNPKQGTILVDQIAFE